MSELCSCSPVSLLLLLLPLLLLPLLLLLLLSLLLLLLSSLRLLARRLLRLLLPRRLLSWLLLLLLLLLLVLHRFVVRLLAPALGNMFLYVRVHSCKCTYSFVFLWPQHDAPRRSLRWLRCHSCNQRWGGCSGATHKNSNLQWPW